MSNFMVFNTVYNLLYTLPLKEICNVMIEEGYETEDSNILLIEYSEFVNRLLGYEPIIDKSSILLGIEKMSIFEKKKYLSILKFDKQVLLKNKREINAMSSLEYSEDMSIDEVIMYKPLTDYELFQGEGYDLTPWEEILGWSVSYNNIEDCDIARFGAKFLYVLYAKNTTEEELELQRENILERINKFRVENQIELPNENIKENVFKNNSEFICDDEWTERANLINSIETAKVLNKYLSIT